MRMFVMKAPEDWHETVRDAAEASTGGNMSRFVRDAARREAQRQAERRELLARAADFLREQEV